MGTISWQTVRPDDTPELRDITAALDAFHEWLAEHGHMQGFPRVSDKGTAEEMVQQQGFSSLCEFQRRRQRAPKKVADAIWIYELIDAYRSPDHPEHCSRCGSKLRKILLEAMDDDEAGVLCRTCVRDDKGGAITDGL